MEPRDRIVGQVTDLVRQAAGEAMQRTQRHRKRARRTVIRWLKIVASLWAATIAIVVFMISTGRLFGPTGAEGWIATPLMLVAAWVAILFAFRAPKSLPRAPADADIAQLGERIGDWLELQRATLPANAKQQLDAILLRLEALSPQLKLLAPNTPDAAAARRLIGEELPELIGGYQRVPAAFKSQPLHGGPSPDQSLLSGLTTLDEELGRLHSQLAVSDLHALATHNRYLEAKYKRDGKLE